MNKQSRSRLEMSMFWDLIYDSGIELHPRVVERLHRIPLLKPSVYLKHEIDEIAHVNGVTFVVIVHDGARHYFRQCLDSVLAQTNTKFRLVVVDNGTTGDVALVLSALFEQGKIDALINVPLNCWNPRLRDDNPLFDLWNLGAMLAETKYFFHLNSDDFVSPNFVDEMLTLLENSGCVAAAPLVKPVLQTGEENVKLAQRIREGNMQQRFTNGFEAARACVRQTAVPMFARPGGLLCVDTRRLLKSGGYDDMADYTLFFKVGVFGSVGYSDQAHLYWRHHSGQTNHVQAALGFVYYRDYSTYVARYEINELIAEAGNNGLAQDVNQYFAELARANATSALEHAFGFGISVARRAVVNILKEAPLTDSAQILASAVRSRFRYKIGRALKILRRLRTQLSHLARATEVET